MERELLVDAALKSSSNFYIFSHVVFLNENTQGMARRKYWLCDNLYVYAKNSTYMALWKMEMYQTKARESCSQPQR